MGINENINKNLEKEIYNKYKKIVYPMSDIQALRSVSNWNLGKPAESFILNAYYELIQNSKHYIYIENLFFISKSKTDEESNKKSNQSIKVKNEIAYYIRKRIEKTYENKENFKVYILINLLALFQSEIEDSFLVQDILKYTIKSIIKNNGLSLIQQLEKVMGDEWKKYIIFLSLRNHGIAIGVPKTEIIYVHAKLLIVDDTRVIIGSANLNDRSMIGDRDSEFNALIEEQKKICKEWKKNYEAAKFVDELRKKINGRISRN